MNEVKIAGQDAVARSFLSLAKWSLAVWSRANCLLFALLGASFGTTSVFGQSLASSSVDDSTWQRMLEAGEFALADTGSTLTEHRRRQLAQAQHQQGAHGAALVTMMAGHSSTTEGRLSRHEFLNRPSGSSSLGSSGSGQPFRPLGGQAAGGQVQADFTSLINLIQTTVDPLSWEDAGGTGVITEYPNGVLIDAAGRLAFGDGKEKRRPELLDGPAESLELSNRADLTFVSLPRLEMELQRLVLSGQPIPPSLNYLDGMYDIHYVIVDPEHQDLLLAGPAGPWEMNDQGQAINKDTGKAVLMLDDLVVCLRSVFRGKGVLGCSIDPRPGQFQEINQYLAKHRVTSEKQRKDLRATVGPQDAVVFGVPETSHAAQVLLTADYHLKLLAMGHVKAGRDLPSYLDLCSADDSASEVIRWWFTMGEASIKRDAAGRLFQLSGSPMALNTESQMLNRQRAADQSVAARQFVQRFNQNLDQVQVQFPAYSQLENLFELAICVQTIHSHQLEQEVNWDAAFLIGKPGSDRFQMTVYPPIKEVELVINHRQEKRRIQGKLVRQTVTAISGGVDTGTSAKRIRQLTTEQTVAEPEAWKKLQVQRTDEAESRGSTDHHFRWARN